MNKLQLTLKINPFVSSYSRTRNVCDPPASGRYFILCRSNIFLFSCKRSVVTICTSITYCQFVPPGNHSEITPVRQFRGCYGTTVASTQHPVRAVPGRGGNKGAVSAYRGQGLPPDRKLYKTNASKVI